MTVARALAEWGLSLTLDDVPAIAQRDACLHLVDGIGCAVAAVRTKEAPYAIAAALQLAGPKEATIISDGARVSAPAAALANGVLIHALDFDDTHTAALVHPTAVVLPTAFAVGEELSSSGAEVLAAAIAGYETVIRLGAVTKHGFHEHGFHATSVCGVFASALVAAKLMGLAREQTVNALGIAGSAAAGSLEFLRTGSATKQLHPGLASMNGIMAARLAASGAEGPESIFEGEYGLFRSYLGQAVDVAAVTVLLGDEWEVSRVDIKQHPACHLSLAALKALHELKPDRIEEIDEIVFEMSEGSIPIVFEPIEEKRAPRSAYDAKFSLPYCAALLLLDERLAVESFSAEVRARKDVLRLAQRIRYEPLRIPFNGAPATAPGFVRIRYSDGSTVRNERAAYSYGYGVVDEPVLIDKFRANGGSDELLHSILGLAKLPNVCGILA